MRLRGLVFCLSLSLILFGSIAKAQGFSTQARNAILMDATTGAVLMQKDADIPIPPASMSKLMTVAMVFNALASGRLSLDDEFPVSEKAWKMGGSKMFVRVGDRITIRNLLRGIIIQSGNDASIVIAEGLAGSEEEFAKRMTERARELGMKNATFRNATGWPAEGHRMSVRDLAIIARHLIEEFPQLYPLYSERSFTWEGISQRNRNPLLGIDGLGADGLKTGHTEEAGYGLVGSAVKDGRRLIVVVAGLPNQKERAFEAERILAWGFREFDTTRLLGPGVIVGSVPVWIGAERNVPLVVRDWVTMTTQFGQANRISGKIIADAPVKAPIAEGDQLGVLRLTAPGVAHIDVPLYAGQAVAQGGMTEKLKAGAGWLIGGAINALRPAPVAETAQ